jgi:hypothetical protein
MRALVAAIVGLAWVIALVAPRAAEGQGTMLYPDMFPYVEENATANFKTLQAWTLSGNQIQFSTLFANKGQGLFEIRKGSPVSATHYQLLQRVYINNDFGSQFVDLPIGTAPIPGTAASPDPSDLNAIWFEGFTKFSLLQANVVDGLITVGNEVAVTNKTSWRLSANRGPLPGYSNTPQNSPDQSMQQRISVGWADLYGAGSTGQAINITGIPLSGRYWLRQTVDPLNRITESNENNNSYEILIDLTKPGEAVMFAGEFVQPGDSVPPTPGDLNTDGAINLNDWLAFKVGATTSLSGLSNRDAYLLGDLNLDGQHSLSDVTLFRQYFDAANGAGAFAALQSVPEPSAWLLWSTGGLLGWCLLRKLRRHRRTVVKLTLAALCFLGPQGVESVSANVTLFSENFEGLTLGPNVTEALANTQAWTQTPPAGWSINDTGVPTLGIATRGVKEWEGWSFANKNWWVQAAGDQNRGQFTLGSGIVAVADPDEWDDIGAPVNGGNGLPALGYYNALMRTPAIALGATPNRTAKLSFASSWRNECCDDGASRTNNQTAVVRASYNGGSTFTDVLKWDSLSTSPTFKNDAPNEQVTINLNNPAGATSVILEFGLLNAGNDWWWAIDNVEVFAPSTLIVDSSTGRMTINNAANLAGYEITSASGSLNPAGWTAGNLDSQNYGSPTPMTADFNNNASVDAADYNEWRDNVGAGSAGDANGDGQTNAADYALWTAQFDRTVSPGQSWETLIASESQLLEYFLEGSSNFASAQVGAGFDTIQNTRDLQFRYSLADGREFTGAVGYTTASAASFATVPEPHTLAILLGLLSAGGLVFVRRPA